MVRQPTRLLGSGLLVACSLFCAHQRPVHRHQCAVMANQWTQPCDCGRVREIAQAKMVDLSANDIDAAMKIIEGSARSMGLEVVEG